MKRKRRLKAIMSVPIPPNESQRLASLQSFGVLDTPFEKEYDDLCQLAATICETPIALISLVDADRQWFKSVVGLDVRETSRDQAFCAHAIFQDKIFEVPDAVADKRFSDNPLVVGKPDIRFYAGQPLMSSEGFALGTLCTIDTVPRTLEPHQRLALDILARQVVTHLELRKATQDLKKLNDDKDRFLSIIAHDLRSPFAGLIGLIDLMKAERERLSLEEVFRYVDMIHVALHGAFDLSENLLRWALLEQGRMSFEPESLPVGILFDEVLASLSEALQRKKIEAKVGPVEELSVTGDRNMLETALRNLVSNAIKFTHPGGKIFLLAEVGQASSRLSVRDNGSGITGAELAKLREGLRPRSRPGTEGESGTGLGLTLVRQFASRHGGHLEIDSTLGEGTAVTLVLPRT